jgi:hypothetical protein
MGFQHSHLECLCGVVLTCASSTSATSTNGTEDINGFSIAQC